MMQDTQTFCAAGTPFFPETLSRASVQVRQHGAWSFWALFYSPFLINLLVEMFHVNQSWSLYGTTSGVQKRMKKDQLSQSLTDNRSDLLRYLTRLLIRPELAEEAYQQTAVNDFFKGSEKNPLLHGDEGLDRRFRALQDQEPLKPSTWQKMLLGLLEEWKGDTPSREPSA